MCPLYDIKDKVTGEIKEVFMSISEYEKYKEENPDHEQVFNTLNFQDSVSLGVKRPPKDFQEGVIERIKRNTPGHKIESRWD
jgi:hypothetical protein